MKYQFRNLVFEGAGVNGIAYVGAMKVIEEKGILENVLRVGGTSSGAINATLVALGFTNNEQREILTRLNFKDFMDANRWLIINTFRLFKHFGWHKGDFFRKWMGECIEKKLGKAEATFEDLENRGRPRLYVYGTNLSTHFGQVFSIEDSPEMPIVDAVRISMSIPLFFKAVRLKYQYNDVFVDGGLLNAYPVRLFDRAKYVTPENENEQFIKDHPDSNSYVYNKETLGIRVDSKREIDAFRYGPGMNRQRIGSFPEYVKALTATIMESQANRHLHSEDWHRTINIDSRGFSSGEFNLLESTKKELENSGEMAAREYLDKWSAQDLEKPLNLPEP